VIAAFAAGIATAAGCYDFSLEGRDADAGAEGGAVAGGDGGSCADGRFACRADGVTLERCVDGGFARVVQCGGGCAPGDASGATEAACKPPIACTPGGFYCGGDKLDGDPDVLYRCAANGNHAVAERCGGAGSCLVQPGRDDRCR